MIPGISGRTKNENDYIGAEWRRFRTPNCALPGEIFLRAPIPFVGVSCTHAIFRDLQITQFSGTKGELFLCWAGTILFRIVKPTHLAARVP